VLRLAGRFCSTERGRERVLGLTPAGAAPEVAQLRSVTRDLIGRRAVRSPVPLGGLDEGAALLFPLGPAGLALSPEDLLDLFTLVERSEGARHAVPIPDLELLALAGLLAPLADFSDLASEKDRVFEADGRVKDTATVRLHSVRAAILRLRRDVVKRLEELVREKADFLSEGYVTEKGGRYCLPLRADRRDALPGIVHEKSGSGQTLFVEPLAVVEANNALTEALEEEREEVRRILAALTARFAARKGDLLAAVGVLTELDAFQARAEWSSRVDGVFPEEGDRVVLRAARHPLLDRRLAPLREEVFGENAAERASDAVPLNLEMSEGKRLLLLSGPNAGGKTVVLKTVGLFALLAQSGFALPASRGTSLPVFDRILVVAGDAQDLLGDLSSFEAAMTRTARVLASATEKSLVLLDELGSGTDPDEGSALAVALLAHETVRGGLTVATTHLSAVKEWGHGEPAVLSAAMEFDEASGRPTYAIHPGAIGRSRALAVAERSGLPRAVLDAARERLGAAWAAADAALARLEAETQGARTERERAQALAAEAETRLDVLTREKAALAAEKSRLAEKARERIDRALEALRETTRREIERLREELRAGRAVSRGALMTVTNTARQAALDFVGDKKAPEGPGGSVAVGELVRVRPWKATGRLLRLDTARGEAEVDLGGKRMKVEASVLAPAGGSSPPPVPRVTPRPTPPPRPAAASAVAAPAAEIVLVGKRVDEALPEVEQALNAALLSGRSSLRIVHGHGTGRLAAAVREFLDDHPGVAAHRPGEPREGGLAVTIAVLDV
jgi:DNA mismatch repair protein MutS2